MACQVRLYRPFTADSTRGNPPPRNLTVLDRTKSPAPSQPLTSTWPGVRVSKFGQQPIYSGRYGLGSKDTTPAQIIAVYKNAAKAGAKKRFTVGIVDDVTGLSLDVDENPDTSPAGTTSCKFWGLGSDGTVGANKNSIKIIGDHTNITRRRICV
jgi:pyruvate-ferredoxin/flavodoxin oxidoreductase